MAPFFSIARWQAFLGKLCAVTTCKYKAKARIVTTTIDNKRPLFDTIT